MHVKGLTALLLLTAAAASSAQSRQDLLLEQKRDKAERLVEESVSRSEKRIRALEKSRFPQNIFVKGFHGVRPLIGGMPSGSGAVAGIGYVRGLDYELVNIEANARYSTRDFTQLDAAVEIPTARYGSPVRARFETEYHDYTSLRFFGLGNDSSADNKSFYREIASSFSGGLVADLGRRFRMGADGGWLRLDAGESDRSPTLSDRLDPSRIPGLIGERTEFAVYGGNVTVDLLDDEIPAAGLSVRFDAKRYDDRADNLYGFTRYVADVKGYIPLGYRNRYVALRFRTSQAVTDGGQRVPLYLMETLGGAGTIRGFSEERFRDTRNLLMSAEYRWEAWTHLDLAIFLDAGKVFSRADDFNFSGLHTGYGFGARFHTPGGFVLRFDLAQSPEGTKLHIGAGPSF